MATSMAAHASHRDRWSTAWSNGGPERDVADVEVEGGKSQDLRAHPERLSLSLALHLLLHQ